MSKKLENLDFIRPLINAKPPKVGIISTLWNLEIVDKLKNSCLQKLSEYQITPTTELTVPGSYEIPVACKKIVFEVDVIITLGCLIQGETQHMNLVASTVSQKIGDISVTNNIPIIFGILTVENIQQAIDRIPLASEYVESALLMTTLDAQSKVNQKIKASLEIIKNILSQNKKIALSFNGGKDSTIVLDLISKSGNLKNTEIIFFSEEEKEFSEIHQIIDKIEKHYNIQIQKISALHGIKNAVIQYLQNTKIEIFFLGQRIGDPNLKNSENWGNVRYVNPILEWTYYEVWYYILKNKIPYCQLYEQGYTSLGLRSNSISNPVLRGQPAWYLKDSTLERAGRQQKLLKTTVSEALEDLRSGKMIILTDDESRENEGDLVFAGHLCTPNLINFMITHAKGLVCLTLEEDDVQRLQLPPMSRENQCTKETAFTVSIDSKDCSTGISAYERSETVLKAVNLSSTQSDFITPGHIFPLKGRKGGLRVRRGHTEGSLALTRLAFPELQGFANSAVICEIIKDDGTMARKTDLQQFAQKHGLCLISIQDVIEYSNPELRMAKLPTTISEKGRIFGYQDSKGQQHLVFQNLKNPGIPLLRIHSQCLTGDVFGSLRCDCGQQLQKSMEMIEADPIGGAVIYLTHHEGRGIGLCNKIDSYILQDHGGLDTVEANVALGFEVDQRDYQVAVEILKEKLRWKEIRLLTNNHLKQIELQKAGISVTHVSVLSEPNEFNKNYLQTKRNKLGHQL